MRIITATPDFWGNSEGKPITPYRWQREVMPVLLRYYSQAKPEPGVVSATMGSGKTRTIAQFVAHCIPDPNEVIIISAPTIMLVQQLQDTLGERLEGEFMSGAKVGVFYGEVKDLSTPVIIACVDSLPLLCACLKQRNRRVALWIVDECHRSEAKTTIDAVAELNPDRLLGFTATPFLSDEKKTLTLFKTLLYRLKYDEALRDGIVCLWKIVNWTGGGEEEGEDGERKAPTLNQACMQMCREAIGPGIFNAFNIADAEKFAGELRTQGFKADAVHSKMSRRDIKDRIAALESGQLWALVQVSLLTEGVDFPWLKFLCLRRPMSSRVAFCQLLGRCLRAYPGKTEAIIYDPHSLMECFSITPEEALGGVTEIDDADGNELSDSERAEKEMMLFADDMMRSVNKSRSNSKIPLDIKPMQTYLTTLTNAFDVCGLIDRKVLGHSWRSKAATRKQQSAIVQMNWVPTARKCIPRIHQRALALIAGRYESDGDRAKFALAMNRGTAGDLFGILKSLADKSKWPDLKNLDTAAVEGMRKADEASRQKKLPTENTMALIVPTKPPPPKMEQGMFFDNKKPKVI